MSTEVFLLCAIPLIAILVPWVIWFLVIVPRDGYSGANTRRI